MRLKQHLSIKLKYRIQQDLPNPHHLKMSHRIFVMCRSNHDPIEIANLACQNLLRRKYNHESDYVRCAGKFESAQENRKCQVLVDCSVGKREVGKGIPLVCYQAISKDAQM
jgi:hypothetical protein